MSKKAEILSSGTGLLSLKAVSLSSRAVRILKASGGVPGLFFCLQPPFQDSGMAKPAIFSDLSSCYPDIRRGRY